MIRGPIESFLATLEIFVDCIIVGYSMNLFWGMTREEFNLNPRMNLWVLFDNILMFFTLFYVLTTQKNIITNETVKNIYTLFFLQKERILQNA